MEINVRSWAKTVCSATGVVLAGPGGAFIGTLAGGLLASVLPGASVLVGDVIGKLTTVALEKSSEKILNRLSSSEKLQINHDLQTAFRDAFREAIYDLGGERCFPNAWRVKRDVPTKMVYPLTPQGNRLWTSKNPLAEQVCSCLNQMHEAVVKEKLLPLEPPADKPASDVRMYFESENIESLNNTFFLQVIAPFLQNYRSLLNEIPYFEAHIKQYTLDRTLIHLGELLKQRTPAWRAFNRLLLEEMRDDMRNVGITQNEILERLDTLVSSSETQPLTELTNSMAILFTATGQIEKRLDEGFDSLFGRVVSQHTELLVHFDQVLKVSGRIEAKVERVLKILEDGRYIIEGAPIVAVDTPPSPGEPPFKGLQHFEETDAGQFYGREMLTAHLIKRISSILSSSALIQKSALASEKSFDVDGPFLAIVGASGSGKSSLVRAGIIPALKSGKLLSDESLPPIGCTSWPIHIITPTANPLEMCAASLTRHLKSISDQRSLVKELSEDSHTLYLYVQKLLSQPSATKKKSVRQIPTAKHLLLVVDQLEELFTLCRDTDERKSFINNLMDAVSQGPAGALILIITLRADFYAHCAEYKNLRTALEKNQAYIGPMNSDELRRAIEEPARHGGIDGVRWNFEPGLVDLFLRDVSNEPGALPLLSHALLETWKHRRGNTLTLESYAESGGVRGAIAKTADTVIHHQLTLEQQQIARNIFLRLTELGSESDFGLPTPDTRRRATLNELIPRPEDTLLVETVLNQLIEARLITISEGSIEVAHEALIREWPTLRRWLDDNRNSLKLHRQITEAAMTWSSLNMDTGALYRGVRLNQAIEWAETHEDQLNALERDFINISKQISEQKIAELEAHRKREVEAAKKLAEEAEARRLVEELRAREAEQSSLRLRNRNRIITGIGALATFAAFVACILAFTAGILGRQSSLNAALAENNLRTAQAANTQAFQEAETRSTAEAIAIFQKSTAEASQAEAERQSQISLARELAARSTTVIRRNADLGLLIAIEAVKITNQILDVEIPEVQTALYRSLETANFDSVLQGHSDFINNAMVSPIGEYIVTSSSDDTARIWKPDGSMVAILRGHTGDVNSAVFSPDGLHIVTASSDKTARVWSTDGSSLATLSGHTDSVLFANFSPSGKWIITTSLDGSARLWKSTGEFVRTLTGHSSYVLWATFSSNNQYILTTSTDNSAILWNLNGNLEAKLIGHSAVVATAIFSPDNSKILTASWDGTARLWDFAGALLTTITGHTRSLSTAVFSPDGQQILTASYDNTARIWSLEGNLITTLEGHTGPLTLALYSPDSAYIVTTSFDNSARLWTSDGIPINTLEGHTGVVGGADFSPDSAYIVTSSWDGTARVWRIADIFSRVLYGHTGSVLSGAFSPDNKTIVTGGAEGHIRFWKNDGTYVSDHSIHLGPILAINYSTDGKLMLTASMDKTVKLWNDKGEFIRTINGHDGAINSAYFHPTARQILTASDDGTVRLWKYDGTLLNTLEGHQGSVQSAVFSPNGELIASTGDDGNILLWDINGTLLTTIQAHSTTVNTVQFSPDGQHLITSSWDGTAKIFQINGTLVTTLSGHNSAVNSAIFSPDGKLILTASDDGTARLWSNNGEFLAALEDHTDWVYFSRFNSSGTRILTGSDDGTARLWHVYPDMDFMLAEATRKVNRDLTTFECQEFLHTDICPTYH